ncbi:hypothetical protein [Altibacter sp. HG106]|uniref:hypothetical protein n=1 Tax=Altibacter sp. HG106 TaxID=3023937 RepID=UPI0023509CB0|nr:hypothetical protein [Altibacter sp. HG106]MDC7996147.1 hypothetical protein [Altibacter sp. HG106]
MDQQKYLKDISDIKQMMHRSSRFISLSGWSGIAAGCYAIIGAAVAYFFFLPSGGFLLLDSQNFYAMLLVLAGVAVLSILTAVIITTRKAARENTPIWDRTTQRLLLNFLIPLLTGGIYILIKLTSQHYGLTASLMLIFYGLALVNASRYTLGNVKYLGYVEIVVGLLCAAFPGYGLWFWVFGFGIMHIIYGSIMLVQEKN